MGLNRSGGVRLAQTVQRRQAKASPVQNRVASVFFWFIRQEAQTTCWHLRGNQRRGTSIRLCFLYTACIQHHWTLSSRSAYIFPTYSSFSTEGLGVKIRKTNFETMLKQADDWSPCVCQWKHVVACLRSNPIFKDRGARTTCAFCSVWYHKLLNQNPQLTASAPQPTKQPMKDWRSKQIEHTWPHIHAVVLVAQCIFISSSECLSFSSSCDKDG